MESTLTVIAGFAIALCLATVWAYERALRQLRAELAEAEDDCRTFTDLIVEDLQAESRRRHPSQAAYGGADLKVVYGGANLRVVP